MHGFRLTQEVKQEEGGFSGGSIVCSSQGHMFDIGAALGSVEDPEKEGQTLVDQEGVFYTEDDILAQTLSSHPALERVPQEEIPEDAQAVEVPGRQRAAVETNFPGQSQMGGTPIVTDDVPVMAPAQEQMGGEIIDTDIRPESPPAPVARPEAATLGEIPAEHADEPDTPEQAIAAGEAVSGPTETVPEQRPGVTDRPRTKGTR